MNVTGPGQSLLLLLDVVGLLDEQCIPYGVIGALAASAFEELGALIDRLVEADLAANLVPVVLGNMLGGAVLVGGVYWLVYLRERSR